MKPFHEHPLLHDYSEQRRDWMFRADWYCNHCGEEIKGPPFEIGEYVVIRTVAPVVWRVYMRSQFNNPDRARLFESPRKREALRHARQLEARRCDILRALGGDKGSIANNAKEVERLKQKEKES